MTYSFWKISRLRRVRKRCQNESARRFRSSKRIALPSASDRRKFNAKVISTMIPTQIACCAISLFPRAPFRRKAKPTPCPNLSARSPSSAYWIRSPFVRSRHMLSKRKFFCTVFFGLPNALQVIPKRNLSQSQNFKKSISGTCS